MKQQPVTQNTTSSQSLPSWLTSAEQGSVSNTSSLPLYQPFSGQGVAPLTPQQQQAAALASGSVGSAGNVAMGASPALSSAMSFMAPQLSSGNINSTVQGLLSQSSPATQQLINSTNNQLQLNTNTAQTGVDNSLAAEHAFGGGRQAIADADVQNQGAMTEASTDAGLNQNAYNTATSTALSALQGNQTAAGNAANTNVSAANGLSNLGVDLSNINTNDIAGLLGTGGVAQQTQQAGDTFNVGQYTEAQQSPYQQQSTIAQILASLTPGNVSTTGDTSQMSYSNGYLGAAGLGLGLAGLGTGGGATLGGTGITSLLALLSDRRMKEDIVRIGALDDGTPVYRFRYIGQAMTHIGLMAQDVEQFAPEAVGEIKGIKFVDYDKATRRAVASAAVGGA